MPRAVLDADRTTVPFSAEPATRAWVAVWLGVSGIVLCLALSLSLAERIRALRGPLAGLVLAPVLKTSDRP